MEAAEQALVEPRTKNGPYQMSEGARSILEAYTAIEKAFLRAPGGVE